MNTIIIILLTLFVASFIILVVYMAVALYQIKQTAKEAQEVLKKINKNLDNMTDTTEKVKNLVSSSIPLIFSLSSVVTKGIVKFLSNLFGRRK